MRQGFIDYFSLSQYIEKQNDIEADIRTGISFRGTNILILIMAIFVASLGLNTNSTAVIIGAMLISPLMGPIIGLGLGIGIQDFNLLKKSLKNLAMATVISIATSTMFFIISPVGEGHSELLARTSPTIYDVLIAFFGGAAGIVGLASRNKGNVIPGVAIATALMPPLCTVGYGLATMQAHYFIGAIYLFLINSIFIALATFIGVKLLKFKVVKAADVQRAKKVRRIVYTVSVIALLPSIYLTYTMWLNSRYELDVQRFVADECVFDATQVVSQRATIVDGHKVIDITLIGKLMPEDSLRAALTQRLKYYNLEGARLNIYQGDMPVTAAKSAEGQSASDLYLAAQSVISRQQHAIDSLQTLTANGSATDTMAQMLAPELKVLFPQVRRIAVTHVCLANVENAKEATDTTTVALVQYAQKPSAEQSKRLMEYLRVRLGNKGLRVVDY